MMRTLFAVFAAFFAGLWLNERTHRLKAEARSAAQLTALPAPKPVDRRPIDELIPAMKADLDSFDTKSSLMAHFSEIVRAGMEMELTPKQAYDLGEDLIAIASTLSHWDNEQDLKYRMGR
jgi:hypothetical protein